MIDHWLALENHPDFMINLGILSRSHNSLHLDPTMKYDLVKRLIRAQE